MFYRVIIDFCCKDKEIIHGLQTISPLVDEMPFWRDEMAENGRIVPRCGCGD